MVIRGEGEGGMVIEIIQKKAISPHKYFTQLICKTFSLPSPSPAPHMKPIIIYAPRPHSATATHWNKGIIIGEGVQVRERQARFQRRVGNCKVSP